MTQFNQQSPPPVIEEEGVDLARYIDILIDSRWLIISIALVVTFFGVVYAMLAKPIYQANILIQVEDGNSTKGILGGDISALLDVKTGAAAEIEILRSRMIASRAVDNLKLNVSVQPKYFPVFGAWLARRNKQLSDPGFLGFSGYVWGSESVELSTFNVSELLAGTFILTVEANNKYLLEDFNKKLSLKGQIGVALNATTEKGNIELLINSIHAKPGAQFFLSYGDRLDAIEDVQKSIVIAEKGKQSGVIGVTLEGTNPVMTSNILNEIGQEYVQQNVERKSEEAEKSLNFLGRQLPELKRQLEQSEAKYNELRKSGGTIDLKEEAKLILQQSVNAQTKLIELKQKREELLTRFTSDHPAVIGIDNQIRALNAEIKIIAEQIKKLPLLEQDVLRLTRDVKVNTDLYTALLNSSQQLRLIKAGKVGNVRLVDPAIVPKNPIKPNRNNIIFLSVLIGIFFGVISVFIKKSLFGGVNDPHEIEQNLGLTVYASIPHSERQKKLFEQIKNKAKQTLVMATIAPTEIAIESLRSFRTALQFAMLESKNNIVLITGPTPGLGKSFVSVNLAAVLAVTGKKVLLIDGDFRKGYLNQYFGIGREKGFSDHIIGSITLDQAIRKNVIENMDFIPTGNIPPNPSELMLNERFSESLHLLSANYDLVVIDSPPVLAVSETSIIGAYVGAVFMVARAEVSTLGEVKESVKRLKQAGVPIKGVIFNDLKLRPGRYGYKYGRYRHAEYSY
jgi:tyrosine-protein kinase Etk/Wzc